MTRLLKTLGIAGAASVSLMQVPCTFAPHGFSIVPNGLIPNPFSQIWAAIGGFLGT